MKRLNLSKDESSKVVFPPFQVFTKTDTFLYEILDLTHDCLLLIDKSSRLVVYANKACEILYGCTVEELLGTHISFINMTGDITIDKEMKEVISRYPGSYRFESVHRRKDGKTVPVEVISKVVIINGRNYFLSHVTDITRQKKMQGKISRLIERLSVQAYRDHLTGVYSRAYLFDVYLPRVLDRQVAVIMVDVDGFKQINDTAGHLVGDHVLTELVKRLKATVRRKDKIIRYGGDVFLIVLADAELSEAESIARRLAGQVSGSKFVHGENEVTCQVSFGVGAGMAGRLEQFAELVKMADRQLYKNRLERL